MTNKVNFVFILVDQHRFDFTAYENNGTTFTPNLERLANNGTIFKNAYCNAPLCSPSRASIALGRYGSNSGCFTNLHRPPLASPTFVNELKNSGYATSLVGKAHMEIHHYQSDLRSQAQKEYMSSLGWDYSFEISANGMMQTGIKCEYSEYLKSIGMFQKVLEFYRKWGYFMDKKQAEHPFNLHLWPFDENIQETTFVAESALSWLKKRDRCKPFFLQVGFAGPHSPTEASSSFLKLYKDTKESIPFGKNKISKKLENSRKGYRALISQIDYQIGRIYDYLEKEDQLDDTIFIYTSDHGELAGDHGLFDKTSFFEGSIHVPLIISGKGIKKQSSNELVELIDIGSTVADLAKISTHKLDQGISLASLLKGNSTSHRDTVYAEMGCDKMLFDGEYKLMYGDPGIDKRDIGKLHLDKAINIPSSPARLYNIKEDSKELNDLSHNKQYNLKMSEMLNKLLARLNENTQSQPFLDRGVYKAII